MNIWEANDKLNELRMALIWIDALIKDDHFDRAYFLQMKLRFKEEINRIEELKHNKELEDDNRNDR